MIELSPTQWFAVAVVVFGIPLLYLFAGWLLTRRRLSCPACGTKALRCVQWIRATIVVDGKRAPDSWIYYLCESCAAKYKKHLGRNFQVPSDEDWARHCSNVRHG